MQWFGKAIGGILGLLTAGPLGSVLGVMRCVLLAGLPHFIHTASVFVMYSATARRAGIGSNGLPR